MEKTSDRGGEFRSRLMLWHAAHQRPMPWKGEKNPYLVWLSEIILQQTRVEQGLPYYEAFKNRFPAIGDLAAAPDDEVMKLWEGLGYYSRARNMLAAARQVVDQYGGQFPMQYDQIVALPGVGPYTAAAIASFAFNQPYAVLDGNVFRVLARFENLDTPIDSSVGKKAFTALAQQMLDQQQPGAYNQAIMDFGASVCTPRSPACTACPLTLYCKAYASGSVLQLPVKSKKIARRDRYFNYLVIQPAGAQSVWIRQRTEKDIWQLLYEFPMIETGELVDQPGDLYSLAEFQSLMQHTEFVLRKKSPPIRQELTHQRIIGAFWELEIPEKAELPKLDDAIQVDRKNLNKFAFPRLIDGYLKDNSLFLELF